MAQTGQAVWKCLVGGAKKWKNDPLVLESGQIRLQAALLERGRETCRVQFSWSPAHLPFAEMLGLAGQVPLPPYLQRPADAADRERYQTVYARYDGSVAAPTAGLHFTDQVFQSLSARQIETDYVTLHVGAGTFKPVKSETIGDHDMHAEYFDVTTALIRKLRNQSGAGQLVAVGTTSLRTLESLYLMGCKLVQNPDLSLEGLEIKQWDAFETPTTGVSVQASLDQLLAWLDRQGAERLVARTQLMIAPGYTVRMADALVTNFHQPASTLLLLVAAFAGDDWRNIYTYALGHEFRFLSYGDGSLLFRAQM
jgi:S-adenosylmethionine:tRNA ribosyltransferase-isomerase